MGDDASGASAVVRKLIRKGRRTAGGTWSNAQRMVRVTTRYGGSRKMKLRRGGGTKRRMGPRT